MSLTQATFQTLNLIQKFLATPYIVQKPKNCLVINPFYHTVTNKLLTFCVSVNLVFVAIISFLRIHMLVQQWKSSIHTTNTENEIIVNCILIFSTAIALSAMIFVTNHCEEFVTLINQRCSLISSTSTADRNFLLGAHCIKAMFICFVPLIPAVMIFPFIYDVDPFQMIFGNTNLHKLISMACYTCSYAYPVWIFYTFIALQIVLYEGICIYSYSCLPEYIETLNIHRHFHKSYRRYNTWRILVTTDNEIVCSSTVFIIFVGVYLSSCGAYATFTMHHNLYDGVVYLAYVGITCIGFLLANLMTHIEYLPYRNAVKFREQWRPFLEKGEEVRMLKACPISGIGGTGGDFGPYGVCTAVLGLQICNDIVLNTLTLLLLDD